MNVEEILKMMEKGLGEEPKPMVLMSKLILALHSLHGLRSVGKILAHPTNYDRVSLLKVENKEFKKGLRPAGIVL